MLNTAYSLCYKGRACPHDNVNWLHTLSNTSICTPLSVSLTVAQHAEWFVIGPTACSSFQLTLIEHAAERHEVKVSLMVALCGYAVTYSYVNAGMH